MTCSLMHGRNDGAHASRKLNIGSGFHKRAVIATAAVISVQSSLPFIQQTSYEKQHPYTATKRQVDFTPIHLSTTNNNASQFQPRRGHVGLRAQRKPNQHPERKPAKTSQAHIINILHKLDRNGDGNGITTGRNASKEDKELEAMLVEIEM